MTEQTVLQREVVATAIPDGDRMRLPAGMDVMITQELGGSFTIAAPDGRKFRIEGPDADALGKEHTGDEFEEIDEPMSPEDAEKKGWELLKKVHDPEIPINLVDLGLVYELKMHERGDGKLLAVLRMSLTAPGCGMGDVMLDDARRQIMSIPGVEAVDAQVVFDPVWNPSMMSTAAKLKLGML